MEIDMHGRHKERCKGRDRGRERYTSCIVEKEAASTLKQIANGERDREADVETQTRKHTDKSTHRQRATHKKGDTQTREH